MAVQLGVAHHPILPPTCQSRPPDPAEPGRGHFASMRISARSSSSSAPTSPTPPSCASTATNAPNAKRPRPASGSKRSTTGSPRSTTRTGSCRRSATGWGPSRSTRCCASGYAFCPPRSPTTTRPPATATNCRSCKPILAHPDAGRAGVRADLLRASHPRQPRHRPPDHVALIFDRRILHGRKPTRVVQRCQEVQRLTWC